MTQTATPLPCSEPATAPYAGVLAKLSPADRYHEPCAHVCIPRSMPDAVYARLAATFPPLERFQPGAASLDNRVLRIPAHQVIAGPDFSAEWKAFMAYHTSQAFWQAFLQVFADDIRRLHPQLERRIGKPLEEWTAVRRSEGLKGDVYLDALLVVNTPVKSLSNVKGPHIDHRKKLWTGLLYMREDGDRTPGGNLELFRLPPGVRFDRHSVARNEVEITCTVPYASNLFAGFVNCPQALHAPEPRPETPHVRRYVDFVIELEKPVFETPQMNRLRRWFFRHFQREQTR